MTDRNKTPFTKETAPDPFSIGDRVFDHMSGLQGEITDKKWFEPFDCPQCFYGGWLYRHTGRGWALPQWVAYGFLEKVDVGL